MGNLVITIIGIVFCALLLVAGANFLAPKGFVVHNQASANTAQVSAIITDYSNLAMATGHRPTYADYSSVYASNNTANAKYINDGTTITTAATMAYTDANGNSVPIGTWQYMPGCGKAGGAQDCFCLTVAAGASDVTYQATRISALSQMVNPAQSRVEFSTAGPGGASGCASATPVTNPVVCTANSKAGTCWPATAPQGNYYLTVRLNNTGTSGTVDKPVLGGGSTPVDGACDIDNTINHCNPTTNIADIRPDTVTNYTTHNWICPGSAGGEDSPLCMATDGKCGSGVPAPTGGTCNNPVSASNVNNQLTGSTWTCVGTNGGATSPQCSDVNGICGNNPGICSSGSNQNTTIPPYYNVDTSTNTATWTCLGSNGGINPPLCSITYGDCDYTVAPGHCVSGQPGTLSLNTNPETWTCTGSVNGSPGNIAQCSAYNGVCDPAKVGYCSSGTNPAGSGNSSTPAPGYTTTWNCNGTNNDPNSQSCTAINAYCIKDSYPPACSTGSTLSQNPPSGTQTTWTCTGTYGSVDNSTKDPNCSEPTTPPAPGQCSDPMVYKQCIYPPGIDTGTSTSDASGVTRWECLGSDSTQQIGRCSAYDGKCDNTKQYGCAQGSAIPTTEKDDGTTSTWKCAAPPAIGTTNVISGASNSGLCSMTDPIVYIKGPTDFGACSTTCGTGTQTASYTCLDPNGNQVSPSLCGLPTTPTTVDCTSSADCVYGEGYAGGNCHPQNCAQFTLIGHVCNGVDSNNNPVPAPSLQWCILAPITLPCPEETPDCSYQKEARYSPINEQWSTSCDCSGGGNTGIQTAITWDCTDGNTVTPGPSNCSNNHSGGAYEIVPARIRECSCPNN